MVAWWPSRQMGQAPETLQGLQCQCGGWVAWVVVLAWVGWVNLLRAPPSCTRLTIPCSILTQARRASKLFIVGAFNSQLWWCVNTYDVISVPMALLLYVCNSVSLVWITYRVVLTAQRRKVKVEDGKGPAEDSIPTEGGRKSCQAEKSGEKRNLQPNYHRKRESQRDWERGPERERERERDKPTERERLIAGERSRES